MWKIGVSFLSFQNIYCFLKIFQRKSNTESSNDPLEQKFAPNTSDIAFKF